MTNKSYAPSAHKHLMVRLQLTDCPSILEPGKADDLNKALETLVTDVMDMRIAIPARSEYVSDPGNEGYTSNLALTTSHLAQHHWAKTGLLQFDVYSCKCFDEHAVIKYLLDIYNVDVLSCHYAVFDREDLETYHAGYYPNEEYSYGPSS